MKPIRKLTLNKETLGRLDPRKRDADARDFSCVESCFFVTCDGCGVSTGLKGD